MPGKTSKKLSYSLLPPSSPQKKIGMDGNGSVNTSSPTSPILDSPSSVKLSILAPSRSEEHTSELQSRFDLVCRLLLEKKKINETNNLREIIVHYISNII